MDNMLEEAKRVHTEFVTMTKAMEMHNERFVYELRYYGDSYDNSTLGVFFEYEHMIDKLLDVLNWRENYFTSDDIFLIPVSHEIWVEDKFNYDEDIIQEDYRVRICTPNGFQDEHVVFATNIHKQAMENN